MSLRACVVSWLSMLVVAASLAATVGGCANGEMAAPIRRDGGPDTGRMDTGTIFFPDSAVDAGDSPDGGRGTALTCETCVANRDCAEGYCAELSSGAVCLPSCALDSPGCPDGLDCVANFSSGIPEPVCAPVGASCCIDTDGDGYGAGVGCLGLDCDESDFDINESGSETCDGADEDCDGEIDNGDPSTLCPHGVHVAGTACDAGACVIAMCEPGFDDCNAVDADGCEVDIDTITDCGGCGDVCELPNVVEAGCDVGACTVVLCADGFGDCNGVASDGCEQPLTTTTHCGGCGVSCGLSNATSSCSTGTCEVGTCDRNWGDCDGRSMNGCETPLTTNTDCGVCDSVCEPPAGTGTCTTGTCRVTTCAAGLEDCDMSTANGCETSIRTLSNCGACGVTCTFPNGVASCAVGACSLSDCLPGFGSCDGVTSNGCETRVNTVASCGACGVACAPPHATGACDTGTCAIQTCDAGWADCDGNVGNGCETSTRTITDCGSCGTACMRAGAAADCSLGTCRIGSCSTGFSDCDAVDANGCELSIRTITDCGGCGVACARSNAGATCATGACAIASCNTGFSNCDGIDGNGCETSLRTLTSCGTCGAPCSRANATADCSAGTCTIAVCNAGFANCDGVDANGCETPLNTLANCGGCGTTCALANAGESCATGTCEITSCTSGFGDCDASDPNGCETSLRTLTDCATCGTACSRPGASATCSTGTCSIASCSTGFGNCDGNDLNGCEAPLTTLTNCAACGMSCALSNASESCSTGACTLGTCSAGFGNCDGTDSNGCELSLTSLTSCGSCGTACALPNASESCSTGACEITTCTTGFEDCNSTDADGCERSTRTLTDCGSCGTTCSRPGATATCATGTCSIMSCSASVGNCDGIDTNGCEAPLTTLTNCGGCGTACNLANASESCSTGTCALGMCSAGFGNCDGTASNGCEVSLTSLTNCGSCGTTCALTNATESCTTGMCEITACTAGFEDCNSMDADGCERSIRTLTDCGACGTTCTRAGASATCSTGTCSILSCNASAGNCDGNDANGCEAPLTTLTNCGGCGTMCSLANAAESCSTGTCALGACTSGFGNCNGVAADGCEAPLTTLTDCGVCGTACALANATESCSTGTCTVTTCTAGFGNCNGTQSDGCEASLNTLTSCGGCGVTCDLANASETCGGGSCQVLACAAGFANCNGVAADGCEAALNTIGNCGGCGVTCDLANAGETCAAGTCAVTTCNAGFGNCNGMPVDGCEVPLNTLANCAGCGMSCDLANASESCSTGTCSLGVCSAGFANCNANPVDGCEQALNTLTSCGGCGVACNLANATESCASGSCAITGCTAGFGNCNGMPADGCEVPLSTLANCGFCGSVCTTPNATATCGTGTCAVSACNASFYDVNGGASDGCECADDTAPATCSAGAPSLGSLAAIGSSGSAAGKIPLSGGDWYQVTFPIGGGTPTIDFSVNDGTLFRFEVYANACGSGATTCTATSAGGLTSWSFTDNVGSTFTGARAQAWPTTVYIRVSRITSGLSCANYTIRARRL